MGKIKIKKNYPKSRNAFILVALIIAATIITALFSSFSIRVNAKDKITITEFPLPTSQSLPQDIVTGPDGNLWFLEGDTNKIGRITTNGNIIEFQLPLSFNSVKKITVGPDNNLWFTGYGSANLGRLTLAGEITEFPIPFTGSAPYPFGITTGPDGNLWFTESSVGRIGRMTPSGTITEFMLPSSDSAPLGITKGLDGNIWFTEDAVGKIGRITLNGTITEFSISTDLSTPVGITTGPDGNIWFTESNTDKIGQITPSGIITEFQVSTPKFGYNNTWGITSGSDGNLWYTQNYGNNIGRITPGGKVTEFSLSVDNSNPLGITFGPDGNIWFTEEYGNKIGRVNISDIKEPRPPDRDFDLLSPFNNGVTWNVSSGYYNNRNQSSSGCHIGLGPDHCRNQLFGLDMVPDQQNDTDILAPGNGKVIFKGKLEDEDCIGLRITLDNGLNLNVCHFASFNVSQGERIVRGKVLGIRSTPHVHLSLDDRYRIGTLCPGQERCFLPIPFDEQHTLDGIRFEPDPNGEIVSLPYQLCDTRNVDCQFIVGFQQYKGTSGISTNVAIP